MWHQALRIADRPVLPRCRVTPIAPGEATGGGPHRRIFLQLKDIVDLARTFRRRYHYR
ncbi:hypothetical protein Asi02nite_76280 [Asanoa siamensis]|uniref:Uncharacterized protein n=1 Tax=Asanoa siamensis TaxID=926357 RepID=A0ABQ4D3J4_9ACTN|nr:hypothetical protein Asi02nite_76280 [Asanoa siamensis]